MAKRGKNRINQVKEALFLSHARGEGPLSEDLLADQCGVSRTPIREALKELEQEGIIQRRQKRGIVLRKFTARQIRELFEIRELLEVHAFRLACKRIKEKDLALLRKISRRLDAALRQGSAWEANNLDLQFHSKIIGIAGNIYLGRLVKSMNLLSQAFQISTQLVYQPQKQDPFPHEDIIDALETKNPSRGIPLLKRHIEHSRKKLLEVIRA